MIFKYQYIFQNSKKYNQETLIFCQGMSMKDKKIDKQLRLPQITSKTSTSFTSDSNNNSRIRPSSSSKLNDLQKNLFAQLDQYDDLDKKMTKKSKTKKQISPPGSKQISNDRMELDAPYLKKLEKLLPQTYMKLLQAKKPQPLQQNNSAKPKKLKQKQAVESKQQKPKQSKQKKPKDKQEKRESSFAVAQREVQQIFQQYLREEGLDDFGEIKSQDLKQLNQQINSTEADINQIRKNMEDIIKKFGNQCLYLEQMLEK